MLGVRRDVPVWKKQIIIEPHLANLTHAKGVVITEFGPVAVSWRQDHNLLHFEVTVPKDTQAKLYLPNRPERATIMLDGESRKGTEQGSRRVIALSPGLHSGSY